MHAYRTCLAISGPNVHAGPVCDGSNTGSPLAKAGQHHDDELAGHVGPGGHPQRRHHCSARGDAHEQALLLHASTA